MPNIAATITGRMTVAQGVIAGPDSWSTFWGPVGSEAAWIRSRLAACRLAAMNAGADRPSSWREAIALVAVIGVASSWGTRETNWNLAEDTVPEDQADTVPWVFFPSDSSAPEDERRQGKVYADLRAGAAAAVWLARNDLGDEGLRTWADGNPVDGAYQLAGALPTVFSTGQITPNNCLAAVQRVYAQIPTDVRASAGLPVPAFNHTTVRGNTSTTSSGNTSTTSSGNRNGTTFTPDGTVTPDGNATTARGDTSTPSSGDSGSSGVVLLVIAAALLAAMED